MNDVLARILARKRAEVDARASAVRIDEMRARSAAVPPPRGFA